MSGTDEEFARKLTTYLDKSTAELKAGTAYRLQLARQAALARLAEPQRAPELNLAAAGAGGGSGTFGRPTRVWSRSRLWIGILLIAAAGFGYQQWHAYQQLWDAEETDAALLSSDLPFDAYLDRGFQNWLKRTSDE